MKYDSNIRDKNVELVIETIRETTTFEGLYDLFEKLPNEISYLGHRTHECGKVFTDKLVKLAKTEIQVLIAILTLRHGWDLCYNYGGSGNTKVLKSSADGVYWYIAPYLKKHFKIEVTVKPVDPGWGSSGGRKEYESEFEKHLLDIKKVSNRYCQFINPKGDIAQKSITTLVHKLKTYKVCKLIFTSSINSEAGLVLLRKMVEHVNWHNVDVIEIIYCLNAIANRKGFDPGHRDFKLQNEMNIVVLRLSNHFL